MTAGVAKILDAGDQMVTQRIKLDVSDLLRLGSHFAKWIRKRPIPEMELVEGGNNQKTFDRMKCEAGNGDDTVRLPQFGAAIEIPNAYVTSKAARG